MSKVIVRWHWEPDFDLFISKINFDLDFSVLFIIGMMGQLIYEVLIIHIVLMWTSLANNSLLFQGRKENGPSDFQ